MSTEPRVLRYTAFADDPSGGNPAGIVLDASGLDDAAMQAIATEVDYAETAFVTGREGDVRLVRYFSPIAEVPFSQADRPGIVERPVQAQALTNGKA